MAHLGPPQSETHDGTISNALLPLSSTIPNAVWLVTIAPDGNVSFHLVLERSELRQTDLHAEIVGTKCNFTSLPLYELCVLENFELLALMEKTSDLGILSAP